MGSIKSLVARVSVERPWQQQGTYRKIPKISPGAYIFQRPLLRGLYLEGRIHGGAYFRDFTVIVRHAPLENKNLGRYSLV